MKCRKCGAEISAKEKVCSECGTPIQRPILNNRNLRKGSALLQNKNALTIALIVLLIITIISFAKYRSYKGLYEASNTELEKVSAEVKKNKTEIESLKAENESFKAEIESENEPSTEETTDEDSTNDSSDGSNEDSDTNDNTDDSGSDSQDGNDSYVVQPGDTAKRITEGVFGEYTPELWEKLKKANGKGDTDWVAGETVIKP